MIDSTLKLKQYFEKHPHHILEHPNMGICLFYSNGKIIYANEKFASIYHVSARDMQERRIQEFCRYTVQNLPDFLAQLDRSKTVTPQEMYANGSYYLYKIQGLYRYNRFILIVTLVDITPYKRIELALQQANKQLEQIRLLDRITGLNNFTSFEARIQEIYKSKVETPFGMILLDIDGFKKFNLEGGFEYGDIAIKKISTCLEKFMQPNSQSLYHLGGDEFVFILSDIQDWSLYTFAEQIRCEVHKLNLYFSQGVNQRLTVSLAIQKYISGSRFDVDFFLVKLKELLYLAKQRGGNCWIDANTVQSPD